MSVRKNFRGRGCYTLADEGTTHPIYYQDEGTTRFDEGTTRKKDEGATHIFYRL